VNEAVGRILVVEDDTSIQLGLRMNLQREGYDVGIADDGALALERIRSEAWDLVILDLMLPKLNGYEILGAMAEERIPTPVLVLSARTDEDARVMGLDLGAQDYITKPFSVRELLARVRASMRRGNYSRLDANPASSWTFGEVSVDTRTREVHKDGTLIELTATEFNVLEVLIRADGRSLTRRQIFEAVWGKEHHGTHRTIDNFVAQLRGKLEENATEPAHLLTVRGVGYRLAT
jgi:DNA-binding response OmpR family regulator